MQLNLRFIMRRDPKETDKQGFILERRLFQNEIDSKMKTAHAWRQSRSQTLEAFFS